METFRPLKISILRLIQGKNCNLWPIWIRKINLIRCLNRLEAHQEGQIHVTGIELHETMKDIDIVRQDIGMVFQSFNLFPHLTVLENCMAGPNWVRGIDENEAKERAMSLLKQVKDSRAS